MRVLIVEDSTAKADRIRDVLSHTALDQSVFAYAATLTSFYAVIRYEIPDLVVLDMTFDVNSEKSGKEEAAGIEVLQALGTKSKQPRVIIATQHNEFVFKGERIRSADELEQRLLRLFPEMVVGLVKVDLASTDWEAQLLALYFQCISIS